MYNISFLFWEQFWFNQILSTNSSLFNHKESILSSRNVVFILRTFSTQMRTSEFSLCGSRQILLVEADSSAHYRLSSPFYHFVLRTKLSIDLDVTIHASLYMIRFLFFWIAAHRAKYYLWHSLFKLVWHFFYYCCMIVNHLYSLFSSSLDNSWI